MLNLKKVSVLAQELGQKHGKVLAALKSLDARIPVLVKVPNAKGKRVWHVDMSALEAFYGKGLITRIEALEKAVFGESQS